MLQLSCLSRRAVSGAIAFASTNVPVNGGSARATSSAAWGGQTRDDDVAARRQRLQRARVFEPGGCGTHSRLLAPAGREPLHRVPGVVQHRAERCTHLARMQDADDGHGANVTGSPSNVVFEGVVSATTRPRRIPNAAADLLMRRVQQCDARSSSRRSRSCRRAARGIGTEDVRIVLRLVGKSIVNSEFTACSSGVSLR